MDAWRRLALVLGYMALVTCLRECNTVRRESTIHIDWFPFWRFTLPYVKDFHLALPILGDVPCTVGSKFGGIHESREWERSRPFCLPVGKNARAEELERVDALVNHMKSQGVDWLAAIHVGVPVRIVLHKTSIMLNPRIVVQQGGKSTCTVYGPGKTFAEHISFWRNITVEHDRMVGSTSQDVFVKNDACILTWLIMQF